MAWDDAPPTPQELKSTPQVISWDATPPTQEELKGSAPSMLDSKVLGMTPRGLIQGTANILPAAGAFGGGALGAAAGTVAEPGLGTVAGGVSGAALGGGIGTNLKDLIEDHILGQTKHPGEYLADVGEGVGKGAQQEMTGQTIGGLIKGAKAIPGLIKGAAESPAGTEKLVYDPFLKASTAPGHTTGELGKLNLDNPDWWRNSPNAADVPKTATQKAAGLIQDASEKAQEIGGKTKEVLADALPYVAKIVGAATGHFPGYAAAEALNSPVGRKGLGVASNVAKDAASNIADNPQAIGLIARAVEAQKKKESDRKPNNR